MSLEKNYTHVAINRETKDKITIMASIRHIRIYDLVREWADDAWEDLKLAGKVNDSMLEQVEQKVA